MSAIAPYAIARRLSELAQILTDQLMKVLLPLASQLHAENDHARLRSLYITSTRLTIALFLPVGGALIVLGPPILAAWVGSAYAEYAHLVTILTLASLINISMWPAASILQSMSRHRPLAAMSLGNGLANLVLSVALVHRFGLTGVALGTLIPTAAESLGLVLPYALRVIGVSATEAFKEIFLPAFLPAVPMAVILYVLRQAAEPSSLLSITLVAAAGLSAYAIGYLRVGASHVERQTCRRFAHTTIDFAKGYLGR
jgi:O-antigen/teichoic acid export membrane protein